MNNDLQVSIIREGVKLPAYATPDSVGLDLATPEDVWVQPGAVAFIRTGLVMKPPAGTYIQLHVRSSVGIKRNCVLANGTGIIDPDYSGPEDEIIVALRNAGNAPQRFRAGERIAQAVLTPAFQAGVRLVTPSKVGDSRGGIGSTGR